MVAIILVESWLDCFVFILLLYRLAPAVWNFMVFALKYLGETWLLSGTAMIMLVVMVVVII